MAAIKMEEYQTTTGKWKVNFPQLLTFENPHLATQDIMGLYTIQFMFYIIEKYNAKMEFFYNEDGSIKWYSYYFENHSDCHSHLLEVNRIIREKGVKLEDFK